MPKQLNMDLCPKDRPVLLQFDKGWTQGEWSEDFYDYHRDAYGGWSAIRLPEHGCGCCSATNPDPIAWMELPDAQTA